MRKRLCSIILCLCLVAGIMPTTAWAYDYDYNYSFEDASNHFYGYGDNGHDDGTWTAWNNPWALPSEPGKYYLTTDVTLTTPWARPCTRNSAVPGYILCQNSHNINIIGSFKPDVYTGEWGDGKIALGDCTNQGKILHDHRYNCTPIEPITDTDLTELSAGEYYLTNDYELSDYWKVRSGIHFCSAGKTLTGSWGYDDEICSDEDHFDYNVSTDCNQTTDGTISRGHSGWTPWNDATTLPTHTGNYYLTKNVTISMNTSGRWDSALTIAAGNNVNLCLEGYTVSTEGSGSGYLMKVENGASFNLYDEYFHQTKIVDENRQGKIVNNGTFSGILNFGTFTLDGAVLKNFQSDLSGAAVYSEGTFNMKEGMITADNDKMVTAVSIVGGGSEFNMSGGMITKATGMGVVVSSHPDNVRNDATHATFNMTGGMIYGNTAGVLIDGEGRVSGTTYTDSETHQTDDVFTMTGGAISCNKLSYDQSSKSYTPHQAWCEKYRGSYSRNIAPSQNDGAGVCNYGNFDMRGGLVANNYNYYYDFRYANFYPGGGVANYGTYCLADQGTVASNYAGDGTGVYNSASFTMDGGTIRSNELADRYSAGCGVYNSGTFTLQDGLIRDNVSGDQDNWYASDGGGIYNSNSGSLTMYGGTITRNRSSGNGAGVCNRGAMKLYGGSISSNACWYWGSNMSYKYGFEAAGVAGNLPVIGGNPVVQGNGYGYWFYSHPDSNEGDIFVDDTHQITIDPDHLLTDGAKIGVWSTRKPTADNPVYITNEDDSIIATEFSRYFTSNDTNYKTKNDPNTNRVILGIPSCTVEYYLQNTDKTDYTLSTDATNSSHATGSLTIDSLKKDFTGFTFEKAVLNDTTDYTNGSLTANDEDVIKVYYTRNQYNVTLDADSGVYSAGYTAPTSYTYGVTLTLPTADNISKRGYLFDGWYENADFSGSAVTEIPSTEIGEKTYYAKWRSIMKPVDPSLGAYKVEHYKEQLDGNFTLAETEFPLYGEIGQTATAVAKSYANYTEDTTSEYRVASDTIVKPTIVDNVATVTTLKLYYKLNKHTVQYDLNGGTAAENASYDDITIKHGQAIDAAAAPARDGYVFTGWKDTDGNLYYAGQEITPTGDMTLTAQWQSINEWIETALNVSVDVNVNVSVSQNADAAVSADSTTALQSTATAFIKSILEGNTPDDFDPKTVSEIRALANSGAEKLNIVLTVGAQLTGEPSAEEKAALNSQMASNEIAQTWQLTISMGANATMNDGTSVGSPVSAFALNETHTPITFTLTTGQDLSGKDVRVLYIHSGAVETAESSVTDAANGVVSVTASKFSPYIILSKTRASSGGSHSSSGTATYPVKIADKNPTGGAVSADKSSAAKGATVTVTVTPDKGYELGKLTVTDKDDKAVSLTAKGSGKYTFTMPAGQVTIAAAFTESDWTLSYRNCPKDKTCPIYPFTDAKTTDWYHDGVHFCLENKLMVGYGDNLFKPEDGTSRAMIAVMLWRLNGSPAAKTDVSFDDVGDGTWYTDAVRWATSEGIAQGYGNGKFGPNDTMTREQMVTILYRYAKANGYDVSVGEDTNILSYTDAASVAQYAIPAMQWACGSGMVQGSGNALLPQGSTTRAQMATMMMRFCAEIVK